MANLFERLIKQDLPSDPGPSEQPISIHAFNASIEEWQNDEISGAEAVQWYDLDSGQANEAQVLKDYLNAAPDKAKFLSVFKNYLYCGEVELGVDDGDLRYVTRAQFLDRLQREIVDQGGTVP